MSNENEKGQNNGGQKSILLQVREEAAKAKRESAKAEMKKLLNDYNAAVAVVAGIEAKIVETLKSVGEDEATIRSLLATE